ncbi:MAG: single-stranded-DNA-specific exonuclease RecJ [Anaerolineales bacterium]|jgi:single-stranded-DNA-specific exonuclease|nr:single-stranded-DNA-specific exonuclease RecJ [Anaerolineales bacterium]
MISEWIPPSPCQVPEGFESLVGGHPLIAQALVRRGIANEQAALAFLNPQMYQPAPPEDLPGIEAAVARLQHAIQAQEQICVWGDFDVDGQTATTLLVETLRELGGRVVYYIPVRARESHGVHLPRLSQLIDDGASVILTCDTGIAAVEAAAYARSRQVDFIVTDHHELPEELPPAYSITNPQLLPPGHPLRTLPGVGVAFKLAECLLNRYGMPEKADRLLDLVALGIVADVALLRGDTRYLLQRGMEALSQPERVGLLALMDEAGLNPVHITEEHIGYMLAPRLNALGRLGDANSIVELLTTRDPAQAKIMALELEGLNAQRQLLTNQVFQAALQQIERDPKLLEYPVLVLSSPTWPGGILGIVASRLVEYYQRPAILIQIPPDKPGRGSARSVEGVHITQAIAAEKQLVLSYGGHAMAAGLSILPENIQAFRAGISRHIQEQKGGLQPVKMLEIDGMLSLTEINRELVEDIERLAPFGPGNPPLILAASNLSLVSRRTIGRTAEHLLLTVQDEAENTQEVIWWQGAGWPIPEGRFDLAFTLHASNFRGQPGVQVQWVEARSVISETSAEARRPLPLIVQDFRQAAFPGEQLRMLQGEPGIQLWREAGASHKLEGKDRLGLAPAHTLVIWTIPPGRAELQQAVEHTRPQKVILFANDPGMDQPDAFLARIAGLVKYALQHKSGKTSLQGLAAATAQRTTAVLAGLEWMQARGMLAFSISDSNEIELAASNSKKDQEQAARAEKRLNAILRETAAFRSFYTRADAESLFAGPSSKKEN